MERFTEVVGRNFIKLELKVIRLFLQDKFLLEFQKVAPLLHYGHRQMGLCQKWVKSVLFCSLKFNRGQ